MNSFPIQEWLTELIMQEDRDTYHAMTRDQQRVVRMAYLYGLVVARKERHV